jgi:hypothetical protein
MGPPSLLANGPVLLIRAEKERVLFGFWRGQRLTELEPQLKKGGKYEMATMEFLAGSATRPALVRRLTKEAVSLNQTLGDPTHAAKLIAQGPKASKNKQHFAAADFGTGQALARGAVQDRRQK